MPGFPAISGAFIKLSELDELQPGDDIRIEVRDTIWLLDVTVQAAIESKLRADPRIDLYHWERTDDAIIYFVRIKEPDPDADPETQQAGVISAGVIIAAIIGVAAMFTTVTIYKTVNSPGGRVISTMAIAIVIVAALYIFSKVKK